MDLKAVAPPSLVSLGGERIFVVWVFFTLTAGETGAKANIESSRHRSVFSGLLSLVAFAQSEESFVLGRSMANIFACDLFLRAVAMGEIFLGLLPTTMVHFLGGEVEVRAKELPLVAALILRDRGIAARILQIVRSGAPADGLCSVGGFPVVLVSATEPSLPPGLFRKARLSIVQVAMTL